MRTRKLLALLLVLVMSLTMGGLTVFAQEVKDAGTEELPPTTAEPADPMEPSDDFDKEPFPEPDEKPSLKIKGVPTEPVKAGDTVSFTVEMGPGDVDGWYLEVSDSLWDEIEDLMAPGTRRVDLVDGKATVTYKIPDNHFFYDKLYFGRISAIYEKGDTWITVPEISYTLPSDRIALTGEVEFQTTGLVTGKEYPFTVTWKNESEIAINDFVTDINVGGMYGPEESGKKATFKVTSIPEGAVTKQGFRSLSISNLSIPAGKTLKISGTVLFAHASEEGALYFEEKINGKWFDRVGKSGFTVTASTGDNGNGNGNGDASQKPDTETGGNTAKDNTTGIMVSGVEQGVTLSVKSVNKEQQTAIEEQVKKLLGNTKGIKIFDISLLKDGEEVQPGTPVKVTMPVPDGFSTNLKLYHQNEKGVLETVNISVKASTISFEAKSFSPYVLVDMGAKAANTTKSNATSPKTGDASAMMLYLVLALAAMGSVGVVTRRKMNG